jgi:hypothetical protein
VLEGDPEQLGLADLASRTVDAIETRSGPQGIDQEQGGSALVLAQLYGLVCGDAARAGHVHDSVNGPPRNVEARGIGQRVHLRGRKAAQKGNRAFGRFSQKLGESRRQMLLVP